MNLVGRTHGNFVYRRRISQLARRIANLLPLKAKVLDVGCGDGALSTEILKARPDISLTGIDVLVRRETLIPVKKFDGSRIPYPDGSFDAVILVDVLHHTMDPTILLREASRVAQKAIIIKDHTRNGFLAKPRLRLMDWVGNAPHGVVLPYNYWSREQWHTEFKNLRLDVTSWFERLELYPRWADWIFGSSLHFVACLASAGAHSSSTQDRSIADRSSPPPDQLQIISPTSAKSGMNHVAFAMRTIFKD
jgi:SAM-dependent methyltransferase